MPARALATRTPDAAAAQARGGVSDMLLQRMAGVVLSSGVGVVRGRADGGPRWANAAFLAMSGYAREDLAGLSWADLAPGEALPAGVADAVASTFEKEFVRKDGSRWPVIVSPGVDPTDAAQLILFVIDLTASKLAEAARRAADQRYARFFEVSNVAFWTADAQGRARLTSTTTADRLRSDVELSALEAQAELLHPDDRSFAIATWQHAIAEGRAYDIEVRARGLDGGEYRWTRLQAFPDIVGGEVVSWYGTTEDVHERRIVADALAESEQRFKRLADDIPVMVWMTDADAMTTYLSKGWYDYTGQTEADGLGRGWLNAIVEEDRVRMSGVAKSIALGKPFDLDFRLRGADGSARWMLSSGRPRLDSTGNVIGFAGALTDIHARKIAERDLAETQLRLSRALDGTGVGVWEWEAETDTVSVSGSALGITGMNAGSEEYLQVDYRRAVHPDDRQRMLTLMSDYIEGRVDEFACEIRLRRRDGGWVWVLDRGLASARDASGRATRMVGTLTNIDDSKRAEELLRWTVDHDALTGLASRTLFHARLDDALLAGGCVALALLDIDHFKGVNDVLGHAAGDALLGVLAQRLAAFAEPSETVARLGGDEFTLIVPDCGGRDAVARRLEELRSHLAEPFVYDGQTLTCRSSIGVALAPEHGNDASSLLKSADIAMYNAKAERRGAVAFYDAAHGDRVRREASALSAVRLALDQGTVVALYEPIVRLADRRVAGFEVIGHIAGRDGCRIDTHEFDALFAERELSCRLGEVLIDACLTHFASWRASGPAPEFLSVNVTSMELCRKDYARRLLERLAELELPPEMLRVEFVETGLDGVAGEDSAVAGLAALAGGGLLGGLDNFGVGSASLSNLARLPLAAVKIHPQLVRDVVRDEKDRLVVRAIAGLGQAFGLRIVALGVETEDQAAVLGDLGCTYGQGPHFGAPVEAERVPHLLKSSRRLLQPSPPPSRG